MSLLDLAPEQFVERLRREGGRASLHRDHEGGRMLASAEWLDELADWINADERDHHEHEGVFFEAGAESGALLAATVHWTTRGQGAGGVRYWPYQSLGGCLRDGLRLSMGMTRKNALAGLWWGGGKGCIAPTRRQDHRDREYRDGLYREYGRFISSIRGCYITAEDVGTSNDDMRALFSQTRHTTCIAPEVGGSGNPAPHTARGVVCAMEGALAQLGSGDLRGKCVAMQGLGAVATAMVDELLARGVERIIAAEIDAGRCERAKSRWSDGRVDVREVSLDDASIFAEPCDVLAPNALGGVLNPDTIATLQAKIVCGAANNQLLDDRRDDAALAQRGIVYVPDFVANRMGIVNCANEQYGAVPNDSAIDKHFDPEWSEGVFRTTQRVLARAEREGVTTSTAANRLADEAARVPHPIWGDRGRAIVQGLVTDGWASRKSG